MSERIMREKVATSRVHAASALVAYRNAHDHTDGGHASPDDQEAIGDMLADLLHLAEAHGVLPSDMDDFVMRALNHYEYESNPEHADEPV